MPANKKIVFILGFGRNGSAVLDTFRREDESRIHRV